ncbi:meiotic recombination [Coemansia brasiliensis]|uniref:Double-strand break repair protein n=1 Tax=Coemansia brasiliensis TaxID=2650707 RepID=A0A9W8LYJ1_9FUNG|nr:meiotic recombination [Coemansia brasiliensis]
MTVGDEDTLSILVATDNHLGYLENDPIRGQDSFHAFAEVLQLARLHKADMVLLGGDLFHDNHPSRKCQYQTLSMLRQNCLGDGPVSLEHLSDPAMDFGESFAYVNYEDPNINVELPVFSIHGNHDDPSGEGNLSAMDMLGVSRLVNYFGRQTNVEHIRVSPVLLRKGKTHLALYGLGNVRDERLHRTIARKRMTMCQPAENSQDWFNLMVLHQNRVPHGPKSYIPEHFLSDFLDLVVWGHEHQCQVDPEYNHQKAFYITQPGSSVATSLSIGEAAAKHAALLHINGRNFKLEKLRLKNVRPFVMEDVVLSAVPSLSPQSSQDEIFEFLSQRIESLIIRAQQQYQEQLDAAHPSITSALGEQPKPLVRVRVEYSGGFETFHPQRFRGPFVDRVANARDIVQFFRKRPAHSATSMSASQRTGSMTTQDTTDSSHASVPAPVEAVHVESLISEFLDDSSLQMLVDLELAEAVRLFVQKGDTDAISRSLKSSIADTQRRVLGNESELDEKALEAQISSTRLQRRQIAEANGYGAIDTPKPTEAAPIKSPDIKIKASLSSKHGDDDNDDGEDSSYEDNSDQNNQENDDLRAAGENLKPSRSARTKTVASRGSSKPVVPSKRKPPAPNKTRANSVVSIPNRSATASESSSDDDAFVTLSSKSRPYQSKINISRPSHNARSSLAASSNNTSAVNTSEEEGEDEDELPETPRAAKRARPNTPSVDSNASIAPTPKPRGRGRGRGSSSRGARQTAKTSRAATRSRASQSSYSGASQAPVPVEIADDSSDEDAGKFSRFSFRKRV